MTDDRIIIQNRMLSHISAEYDKSEGSFFYDAIKPVAIELESSYREQEQILDKGFAGTSTGEYLDKKVAEQGLTRKPATKSTTVVTVTGSQGAVINSGDKVASDTVNFIFSESKIIGALGHESVSVECEELGNVGNLPVGSIKYFPVTLPGLTGVTNPNPLTNGYDGEPDDELRQRYFDKVRTPATSGNKYHYRNWAKEVVGVGDARVFPLWNGTGTVKVVIIDSNKKAAAPELVAETIDYIEVERPIGATVTVISAAEIAININVTLSLSLGYTLEQAKSSIETKVDNYLKEIAFQSDIVSFAILGSLILEANGVCDHSDLTVNGGIANISIGTEEVAVLGVVTVA